MIERGVLDRDGEFIPIVPGRQLIRHPYDGTIFHVLGEEPGESLTVQSAARSTDIGEMVKRWLGGEPVPQFREAQFGDVSRLRDLQEAENQLAVLREAFMELPADVRDYFHNRPMEMAEFLADPANESVARDMGLIPAQEGEAPTPAPAASGVVPKAEGAGDKPA